MSSSIVRALVASTIDTSNDVIGSQRITGPCWFTADPARRLLAQHATLHLLMVMA
jgi:hypothetical protein